MSTYLQDLIGRQNANWVSYVQQRNRLRDLNNMRRHHVYLHSTTQRMADPLRTSLKRRGHNWTEDSWGRITKIKFQRGNTGRGKKVREGPHAAARYPFVPLYRGRGERVGWKFVRDVRDWNAAWRGINAGKPWRRRRLVYDPILPERL